jgi:carbamoyltransferase
VQTVLREAGVPGETVSVVVIATQDATYSEGAGSEARPPLLYRMGTSGPSPAAVSRRIRASFARARRRRVDEALRSEFGFSCPVKFLDHHIVHTIAATALAGRPDCLVVTMDSGADGTWAHVASVEGGRPRRLASQTGPTSMLGLLNAVCEHLRIGEGLDRHRRLEDLAVRGTPAHADRLTPYSVWDDGRVLLHESLFRRGGPLPGLVAGARKEDVAASVLKFAADTVGRFAAHWLARSEHEELVLGGDLFEIPSMVRAVREAAGSAAVVVPVAPGDVGLPVGCAYAGCIPGVLDGGPPPCPGEPLATPFVGISFDDEEVRETLHYEGVPHERQDDVDQSVARVLAEGCAVARFAERTEIGNRGLGNRALLRSPRGQLRRGRVGFLVVRGAYHALVPEGSFADWFDANDVPPERLVGVPGMVTPLPRFTDECPDLVGWEGQVRVQVVSPATTPRLHRILDEFASWSGIPILATAPFRLPDEPLVSSPRDALRTFRLIGADYAAIGDYLVPNPSATVTTPPAPAHEVGSRP